MSKRVVTTFGALALGLLTTACANPYPEPWNTPLPDDLHPITVRETRSAVEIPVEASRSTLSFIEIASIRDIGAEYLAAGHGPISIALPAGGGNDSAASAVGAEARQVLSGLGIPDRAIQTTSYNAAGRTNAPIVVMVDRYVADGPNCHDRWADFARVRNGANSLNFGCANQANLAAVVTDPADLLGPRDQTAPDAGRRSVVLGLYRSGQTTITERADGEGTEISNAVE